MVALNNGEAAIIGDSIGAVLWLFFGKNVTEHGPWHHHAPHTFHVPGQSHCARTSLEVMSRGHHKDLWGFTSASFRTIWNTSLLVICSFYYHMLFTITPYMFMFCLYINTPVCCMYFTSSNINLATYFSLTCSRLLKLLLSSTPDSPTPSGPPKFEASSKRAAQPTSWSQCLAQLWTWHLRPNSELNSSPNCLSKPSLSLSCCAVWNQSQLPNPVMATIVNCILCSVLQYIAP